MRTTDADYATPGLIRQRTIGTTRTLERVASSLFVVGKPPSQTRHHKQQPAIALSKDLDLPYLSAQATVGRNSRFHNLTAKDREKLGGIEYRSLKLLIKVLISMCTSPRPISELTREFSSSACTPSVLFVSWPGSSMQTQNTIKSLKRQDVTEYGGQYLLRTTDLHLSH